MLGHLFGPMLAEGESVARAYVPYPASFGGAPLTGTGTAPFASSVASAQDNLASMAAQAVAQCPATQVGLAGFSGGALVVEGFAEQVGAGRGPIPAERVTGVALLSNPARAAGGDPIPGRPGQFSPDQAPGTDGSATAQIHLTPVPVSGGIAADGTDYGALTGRVAEFCAAGDLSCDAPGHAAALRTAAGLAAQADLRDPIVAASSVGAAWQASTAEASASVLLEDVTVVDGQVNYVPEQSVSQRLAEAADPRTPVPGPDQAAAVGEKIAQITAAVTADPLTQIPRLIGQVAAAVGTNIADNGDLFNPGVLAHYANVVGAHVGYAATGEAERAGDWFAALSRDLTGGGPR
ncbi:cutinase family protein [Nocardia brasiliensis]|uniref:cutinase family protein n=1 Tax=Nocardia brasiliensis TaxID=37326 RepID=UPI0032AE9B36